MSIHEFQNKYSSVTWSMITKQDWFRVSSNVYFVIQVKSNNDCRIQDLVNLDILIDDGFHAPFSYIC